MKKVSIVLLLLFVAMLCACGSQTIVEEDVPSLKENEIYSFFINADRTDMYPVPCEVKQGEDMTEVVSDILNFMMEQPNNTNYQNPMHSSIKLERVEFDSIQNNIKLFFNVVYESIQAEDMLFFKTCVAWTLLQLEEVDSITITLTDIANKDIETATTVETFDRDSFTINFGDKTGYKQTGNIVLYFANEEGDMLKEYIQTVEISNTTSLARLVVESLIAGPVEEGYMPTLSDETVIKNISVNNNICYIDLSDEFYDTANPLGNEIIVYSIVNSLVELPTVSKVQFLKNGEKLPYYRESLPFDGIFERNLDLIEQEENL